MSKKKTRTTTKQQYNMIIKFWSPEAKLKYFEENSFVRLGVDCYPKYRLLLRLLYWTGMRIGEIISYQLSYQCVIMGKVGKKFIRKGRNMI